MASFKRALMNVKMLYVALLATLLIVVGSIVPLPAEISGGETGVSALNVSHLIVYIICSFTWVRSLKSKIVYLTLMVVLIPLTEVLQLIIPYRNSSVGDLITNLTGALLGALFSIFRV